MWDMTGAAWRNCYRKEKRHGKRGAETKCTNSWYCTQGRLVRKVPLGMRRLEGGEWRWVARKNSTILALYFLLPARQWARVALIDFHDPFRDVLGLTPWTPMHIHIAGKKLHSDNLKRWSCHSSGFLYWLASTNWKNISAMRQMNSNCRKFEFEITTLYERIEVGSKVWSEIEFVYVNNFFLRVGEILTPNHIVLRNNL